MGPGPGGGSGRHRLRAPQKPRVHQLLPHRPDIWILTIDVSNLNRQLLFQKKHVGRSKAQVAKESVLQFYPKASIIAYHDSIMKNALIIMSQNCICCEFLIKPSKYIFIS